MLSVIVAAHNEENGLGPCVDRLLAQGVPADEIVVIPNGCTDRTAQCAHDRGVCVVERREPGKSAAINAGEPFAHGFPRIYLDADILVPDGALAAVEKELAEHPDVLAVAPARRMNTAGRPWAVRAYFAVNTQLPAFERSLFGRGMFALSEEGRKRFGEFPTLIADDLFVDSVFAPDEKAVVPEVAIVVEAPMTTRDLLARLERVRRGNSQMRAASQSLGISVRAADHWAWLRDVVLPHPRLWIAAVPYAVITAIAEHRAARPATGAAAWGRDESTRTGLRAA
ncbi:glycosyltransferase family 2 protein [Microbacterium sp. AZCO]|uniref:glycosyltransferase family 2 protein n=1 Tax=Microbacterium sp. AZCO TaxID=3142976 RepID=UPI0031F38C07